ncbi:MAG: response regulator [Chloroflexi bacterium]|nr:response regulator [Chloroflexota bacterium]
MPYKIFLVEDEVTTREGIRDNVDWRSMGFELCGEASDGEIALPQIEAAQPDVLITDIRMPFMDGLQLCRIVREHMPWMKIIIISGYSDFQYAQTAIQLGVTEYLLKPVSVEDLQGVLARLAVALDQEKRERAYMKRLRSQLDVNIGLLREKFLLRLVTGGESSISAIEQSQQLGLNILAPFYQVILLEARRSDGSPPFDYDACQRIEKLITGLVSTNVDALLTKKGLADYILILKGESLDQMVEEGPFLADLIRAEVERNVGCELVTGIGNPQQRLGDLHRSFAEAVANARASREELGTDGLRKLDHAALRAFLDNEPPEAFDAFFEQQIAPLCEASVQSGLLRHYVILDIVLAVSQFISELGGDPAQVAGTDRFNESFVENLKTGEQIRAEIEQLFREAIAFRDTQVNRDRAAIIRQAKSYIAKHFSDPNLSLHEVAAHVNFSPNHFSAVFSSETGRTFREFVTMTRIEQAKRLLRTTRLKCAEIAYRCGYNDSHYFSMIFRKNCAMTPQQYRVSAKINKG